MNNKERVKQAVILAGGLGTRMKPFTDNHPKPMYLFQGVPFIEYLVKQVKNFGLSKILMLLGYMPEQIIDYLGDGKQYGIEIEYHVTPINFDTGNRLKAAAHLLDDKFFLMYCDNYSPVDFDRLHMEFNENNADVQLSAYANKDGYTKNNLKLTDDGMVEFYDKKRTREDLEGVDIGYALMKKTILGFLKRIEGRSVNLEETVYPILSSQGKLYATLTEHRYYSIGSWQRIELTKRFFSNPKTVFLDRDGTLNIKAPKACYIERPEDFRWLDGAMEAVKLLKSAGYRLIVISNQPGIARGKLSEHTLLEIHKKMQHELKEQTGYTIDAIYYCPHNWEEGCECRKPKPGLLFQAQKDFSLDLSKSCMIGDDIRDIQAGTAAGCRCIQVSDEYSLLEAVQELL